MSARTFSISGTQTSVPVASATGATAPTWSKCVCVRRIPSSVTPSVSITEELLRLVAGVDDQRPVGAVAAEQVAVLLHHPDREHADVHWGSACFPGACFLRCRHV